MGLAEAAREYRLGSGAPWLRFLFWHRFDVGLLKTSRHEHHISRFKFDIGEWRWREA
jgi:hypothetical protein